MYKTQSYVSIRLSLLRLLAINFSLFAFPFITISQDVNQLYRASMIRALANANATREVSIVIQRRPHCSAT